MARGKLATQVRTAGQGDLFAYAELFPVRTRLDTPRALDLSLRVKTALSRALKECLDSAPVVAARITELTGREMTADMLYAYTAASKPEHDIGIARFVAFVRATGAVWLWDELLRDDGLVVLQEREALLAQTGLLEQEQARIAARLRELKAELQREPVTVRRGHQTSAGRS